MRANHAVIALVLAISRLAGAEDPRTGAARAAYDAGHQEKTLALLAPVLAGRLDDHERAAALRLAGCAQMVLGNRDAAIARFVESFAIEPDAALEPNLASSPDARSLLERARGDWRAALVTEMDAHAAEIAQLKLAVRAPPRAQGGKPIAIGIDFQDPGRLVSRVELSYRRRGQGAFTLLTQRLTAPTPVQFAIPPDLTASDRAYAFEYHVTLRHQTGFDLRRDGDPDRPHVIQVDPGHATRWYETWWFRGSIAAGVVGLGVGGYLFYRSIDVGGQNVVVR